MAIPIDLIDYAAKDRIPNFHYLLASIKTDGMLTPIVVQRKGDRYQLIDGQMRLLAMQEIGETEIFAEVLPENYNHGRGIKV
jgi:ParB-like chromosome segregation protein Spo0J